jgi:hypothetical protein
MLGNFSSLSQFRQFNYQQGYHWFDADSMRFFGTRLIGDLMGGCVFITSDHDYKRDRKYSIRMAMESGSIHSYAFARYDTLSEARKEAKWLTQALASGEATYDPNKCEIVVTTLLD